MGFSKEKIKSMVIIGLFFITLILTQWVMYDGLFAGNIDTSDVEVKSTQLSKYINPQSYQISFGGLSYTRVYDTRVQNEIWQSVHPILRDVFMNYKTLEAVESFEYIQYFKDQSILLEMPIDLTIQQFCEVYGLEVPPLDVSDIYLSEFILNNRNRQLVLVYDGVTETYYKLDYGTIAFDLSEIIEKVEQSDFIEYRKISDRYSLSSTVDENYNQDNYQLIPFQYGKVVPMIRIQNEIVFVDQEPATGFGDISRTVFGNRMDFVKKLKDVSGSTIYMYGYGEKILTLSPSGPIVFQKEVENASEIQLTFIEAFHIAAGKLERFGYSPEHIFLTDYQLTDGVHTFAFNYKIGDYAVAIENSGGNPIQITVSGDQVTRVYKDLKKFVVQLGNTGVDRLYAIDECIENNYLEVSLYYLQDNNIYDSALENMAYYFPIRSAIEHVELVYTKVNVMDVMTPAWHVEISGRVYVFNAYTGTLIKTYR